jgi:hypothetical protein
MWALVSVVLFLLSPTWIDEAEGSSFPLMETKKERKLGYLK